MGCTPMIIIPERNIIPIHVSVGLKGFFKFEAFKATRLPDGSVYEHPGTRHLLADWAPNKILDSGKNGMAQQAQWHGAGGWCHVGSGSTAPLASDTGLETFVAATNTLQDNTFGAASVAPWYGWRRTTYRFAEGAAAGNLSEAGVGWGSSGSTLVCRHRIVDLLLDPTTITVQADEWLDVTYELRYYAPTSDALGTVTIDSILYDTITRAAQANSSTAWGNGIGVEMGQVSLFASDWKAFDGNLGTVIQDPSGTSADCDNTNQFDNAYSNNSYERGMGSNTGPTGWNLGAGIRSIRIRTTAGNWQTQFNAQSGGATIPKTVNETMQMVWTIAWTERP